MPHRVFDAIVFCTVAPTFELRHGMVHICQKISENAFTERVMSRHMFLKTVREANKVAREIEAGRDNVVPLPAARDEGEEEAVG